MQLVWGLMVTMKMATLSGTNSQTLSLNISRYSKTGKMYFLKCTYFRKRCFIVNFFNALLVCYKRSRNSQKLEHFNGKMVEKVRALFVINTTIFRNKKSQQTLCFFECRIIYDRSSNQQYGVLATSITSAFWHGFYPGYYLFFISVAFMNLSSRKVRRIGHQLDE